MSTRKRKRPPVKGRNYQNINRIRVFGFILAILVIFTLAGVLFYTRVVNPTGKPLFGIMGIKDDKDESQNEDGKDDNDGAGEKDGEGDNNGIDNEDLNNTGEDENSDKLKAPEEVSPQEYLEEVENKIKENNRQTPDKYDESFKEYEKKLNEMELELNHEEMVKDFNDASDEFNTGRESFEKEIEETFGDLDFSLGEVKQD